MPTARDLVFTSRSPGWKPGPALREQPGMAAITDKPRSVLGSVLLGTTFRFTLA